MYNSSGQIGLTRRGFADIKEKCVLKQKLI
jgi:hypothetical protein